MASRIDWYLVELERRLGAHLSPEEAFTVVTEAEDHLRSKVDDLTERGMPYAQAERAATSSFGSPISMAFGVLEQRRSYVRERIGAGIMLLAAALVLVGTCLKFTHTGPGSLVAATPVFIVGAFLTRNLAYKPLLLMGVIGGLTIGAFMVATNVSSSRSIAAYQPREFQERNVAANREAVSELQQGLKKIQAGYDYYRTLKPGHEDNKAPKDNLGKLAMLPRPGYAIYEGDLGLPPMESFGGHRFYEVGQSGAYYSYNAEFYGSGSNWEYHGYRPHEDNDRGGMNPDHQVTLGEARDRWLAVAPSVISTTMDRIQELNQVTLADQQALDAPWRFSPQAFLLGLALGILASIAMIIVQALAIQVGRGFRWVKAAMPRFA